MRTILATLIAIGSLTTVAFATDFEAFLARAERLERQDRFCICHAAGFENRVGLVAIYAPAPNKVLAVCHVPSFVSGNVNGSSSCYHFTPLS